MLVFCTRIVLPRKRQTNDQTPVGITIAFAFLVILAGQTNSFARIISPNDSKVQKTAVSSGASSPRSISVQTIAKGVRSGIREFLETVIRNDAEWRALWQRHTSLQSTPPPLPAIDFKNELVIAIFLGEKPTGGYAVEITSAERSDGVLTITYDEKSPRPGGMTIQALTQPFDIIRLAVTGINKVAFRRLS